MGLRYGVGRTGWEVGGPAGWRRLRGGRRGLRDGWWRGDVGARSIMGRRGRDEPVEGVVGAQRQR